MTSCSILTPAFTLPNSDLHTIRNLCAQNLGAPESQIQLFALVPINQAPFTSKIAVELRSSSFSLTALQDFILKHQLLEQQLQSSREALQACTERPSVVPDQQVTKRIQKLDQDNKKLKRLLKQGLCRTQLQNAENLRVATQKTVENLREEFDLLVKELVAVKEGRQKQEPPPVPDKKPLIPKLKF